MDQLLELFDYYQQTSEYSMVRRPAHMEMQWSKLGDAILEMIEETVNLGLANSEAWGFYHGMRYAIRMIKEFGILLPPLEEK